MKTSVIRYRVADFLKQYPPFDELSEEDLLHLASGGRVVFHESDEYIFRKNQKKTASIWVIQQGRVQIIDELAGGEQLTDLLGEGDLLGSDGGTAPYPHSAKTASDVLLYTIDGAQFWRMAADYPRVGRYLAAIHDTADEGSRGFQAGDANAIGKTSWLDIPGPATEYLARHLVIGHRGDTVREAAVRMTQANSDWIAIEQKDSFRLITARDLRDSFANGAASGDLVESVITSPAATAAPGLTAGDYFLLMMRNHSRALAITTNGSAQSQVLGVVTDDDLSMSTGHNPALWLEQTIHSKSHHDWKRLQLQGLGLIAGALTSAACVDRCGQMTSEFQNAMLDAMIRLSAAELAAEGFSAPPVSHCWLVFGRAGRSEEIVLLHPEIGLVFDDSSESYDSSQYFSALLKKVMLCMVASGLKCMEDSILGDTIPSCQSLSKWTKVFHDVIDDPIGNSVYRRRTLFDFRPVYGDRRLAEELKRTVAAALARGGPFIAIMANDTLSNLPPLTFFDGLVVELDGAQHETLNIESTALGPVSDAARVFVLGAGNLDVTNSRARLRATAITMPTHAQVLHEAAEAFQIAAYQQAIAAFAGESSGSLIRPTRLGRYEQRLLKTSFDAIRRLLEVASTAFHTAA